MDFPPYASQHNGYANGDMFYDYIKHNQDREPSESEWQEFTIYKKAQMLAQTMYESQRQAVEVFKRPKKSKTYKKTSKYWEWQKKSATAEATSSEKEMNHE